MVSLLSWSWRFLFRYSIKLCNPVCPFLSLLCEQLFSSRVESLLNNVRKERASQGTGVCLFTSGNIPPNHLLPKSLGRLQAGVEAEAGGGRARGLAFIPCLSLSGELPTLKTAPLFLL